MAISTNNRFLCFHVKLPQHNKLISHRLAFVARKEVIKAFLLELFSGLALSKGGAKPDMLFQVVLG